MKKVKYFIEVEWNEWHEMRWHYDDDQHNDAHHHSDEDHHHQLYDVIQRQVQWFYNIKFVVKHVKLVRKWIIITMNHLKNWIDWFKTRYHLIHWKYVNFGIRISELEWAFCIPQFIVFRCIDNQIMRF